MNDSEFSYPRIDAGYIRIECNEQGVVVYGFSGKTTTWTWVQLDQFKKEMGVLNGD